MYVPARRALRVLALACVLVPSASARAAPEREVRRLGDWTFSVTRDERTGVGVLEVRRGGARVLRRATEPGGRFTLGGRGAGGRELALGADVDGDARPDAVVVEHTGHAHCCTLVHVWSLGETLDPVATLDAGHGDEGWAFADLDGDPGLEFVTRDWTFAYWRAGFAESPAPGVVLDPRDGRYRADAAAMWRSAPDPRAIELRARAVRADPSWAHATPPAALWATALELLYTGHEDRAWDFVDRAWMGDEASLERFRAELREQIGRSPYVVDLRVGEPVPDDPEAAVREYCRLDFLGMRLSTASALRFRIPERGSWPDEPGWDDMTVVSGYHVSPARISGTTARVTVRWDVLSPTVGPFVPAPTVEEVELELVWADDAWRIRGPLVDPHVSAPVAARHLGLLPDEGPVDVDRAIRALEARGP